MYEIPVGFKFSWGLVYWCTITLSYLGLSSPNLNEVLDHVSMSWSTVCWSVHGV